jgi:predicted TIM-barrel fold metal-dependent hydrolase
MPHPLKPGSLPPGTVDTHVHVFDPLRFPYVPERGYTPGPAPLEALQARHASLQIDRAVLVQPSVYGTDNACMLDAIARAGQARCRGIAVVDPARVMRAQLQALDAAGVRGIRLNLEVRHETDPGRTRAQLEAAAAAVDLPGWCVQLHCAAALLPVLQKGLYAFRVPVVLDHFAGLRAPDARGSGALHTLRELLDTGAVYLKLSAFYRASDDAPGYADLAPLARALIEARADRLLWGSDWPHTGGGAPPRDPGRIEPFRDVDLAASLAALRDWTGDDAALLQRLLVHNPARLYGFADPAVDSIPQETP